MMTLLFGDHFEKVILKKRKCCCNWYQYQFMWRLYLFVLRLGQILTLLLSEWGGWWATWTTCCYNFNLLFFLSEKNLPVVSLEDLGDEGMSVSDIDQFSDEDNQVKPNLQYCTLIVIIFNDTLYCTLCSVISAF